MKKIILVFSMVFVVGLLGVSAFAVDQNQSNTNYFGSYHMSQQNFNRMYNAHKNAANGHMKRHMSSYSYAQMKQIHDSMMGGYESNNSNENDNNNANNTYGNNMMSNYNYGMMNY